MSTIDSKVTIEGFSKLRSSRFKKFVTFWGAPTHADVIEF